MRYLVVQVTTLSGLEDAVNRYIKEGWEPLGGITVNSEGFYQAMVRERSTS